MTRKKENTKPRQQQQQHDSQWRIESPSACYAAQYYPDLVVLQVHSGSDIYRNDGNVAFVNMKLKPLLEAKRQCIVNKCTERWRKHFHRTVAYAGGTPARWSALNVCLRLYRPSYLHIWQLKTFWHESKISIDHVDCHIFENIKAHLRYQFKLLLKIRWWSYLWTKWSSFVMCLRHAIVFMQRNGLRFGLGRHENLY